jgi:hypothetical protein
MMVDATSALADTSAAGRLGIDASGGISSMLGRAIGIRGDRSDIGAMTAAQNAINITSGMLTDDSVTFSNMVRNTRFRQMGMTGLEASAAGKLTTQDLGVIGAGGSAAQQLIMQRGLVSLLNKDGSINQNQVNSYLKTQGEFLDIGGAGGVGMTLSPQIAGMVTAFRKRRAAGASDVELFKENPEAFGAMMQTLEGGGSSSNIAGGFMGGAGSSSTTGIGKKIADGKVSAGTMSDAGEVTTEGAAKQRIKEIQQAASKGMNLENLASVFSSIERAITPERMDAFEKASSNAAKNMEISATNFKELSSQAGELNTQFIKLKETLESLNTSPMNLGGFSTKGNPAQTREQIQDSMNKVKQRVDGKTQ